MSEASKKFQRENAHQFYLGRTPVAGHAELIADPEYQKLIADEKTMEAKYAELIKVVTGGKKTHPQLAPDELSSFGDLSHKREMEHKALQTKLFSLQMDYGVDPGNPDGKTATPSPQPHNDTKPGNEGDDLTMPLRKKEVRTWLGLGPPDFRAWMKENKTAVVPLGSRQKIRLHLSLLHSRDRTRIQVGIKATK